MTGGQALVKSLLQEGIRVIFGLPGVQTYHAMDALSQEPQIRFITTRHEQATTYMADGYARTTGDIGTSLVVPGPGVQNASAGLGTAYAASSPVLMIAGQISVDKIGKNIGLLHEVNDQLDLIRPITKWQARIVRAVEIPATVHEALRQLKTGRPRPVEIEIPPETLSEEIETELYDPEYYPKPEADSKQLNRAIELLVSAKRPIIWAGGGVISSGSWSELQSVAELLNAPVLTTPEGKGSISDAHPLSLGTLRRTTDPSRAYFETCDVVLAVGTRFAEAPIIKAQTIIQIDIDPDEIGRNHDNTVGLQGDAIVILGEMANILSSSEYRSKKSLNDFKAIRSLRLKTASQTQPVWDYLIALRNAIPNDGIVVAGMTQIGYYSRWHFPVYEPRTYLTSSYYGNLGFAYPTALGAKVANPDRVVVAISGDGGFLFNSQEMATAVMHGINVIVVVFNDNSYGNVLRDQETQFEGRIIGSRLYNPDFLKLAEAYGVKGARVSTPTELLTALKGAIEVNCPSLIEVVIGQMPSPF